MDDDAREERLRGRFGFLLVWTTVTIGVVGFLLGNVLLAVYTGTVFFLGLAPSRVVESALPIAGHLIVGLVVIVGVVQSYWVDGRLPQRKDG